MRKLIGAIRRYLTNRPLIVAFITVGAAGEAAAAVARLAA